MLNCENRNQSKATRGLGEMPIKKQDAPHIAILILKKSQILCSFVLPYFKMIKDRTKPVKKINNPEMAKRFIWQTFYLDSSLRNIAAAS